MDTTIHKDSHNKFLSAMPINLVQMSFVLYDIISTVDEKSSILDESMVQRWRVSNVPLRPELDEKKYPSEHKRLNSGNSRQTILHPGGILAENIGSNRGLLTILRNYCSESGYLDGQNVARYRAVTVDCNIYARMMKVH